MNPESNGSRAFRAVRAHAEQAARTIRVFAQGLALVARNAIPAAELLMVEECPVMELALVAALSADERRYVRGMVRGMTDGSWSKLMAIAQERGRDGVFEYIDRAKTGYTMSTGHATSGLSDDDTPEHVAWIAYHDLAQEVGRCREGASCRGCVELHWMAVADADIGRLSVLEAKLLRGEATDEERAEYVELRPRAVRRPTHEVELALQALAKTDGRCHDSSP